MNNTTEHFLGTLSTPGSTREGFGAGLIAAAENDPRVIGLCADLTESLKMDAFAEKFPERFIQVGVAEQNLVGTAAGLALAGKIPFAASYAVFSPGRSWDQLRVSVCYSNLNVKIIGGHAGLTTGADGATHQALEDIAITRVLPNLVVVVPADKLQAYQATQAIAQHVGPVYLRLGREKVPNVIPAHWPFKIGKAQVLQTGRDVSIVACGLMVSQALEAAKILAKKSLSVRVINLHTIKPLDTETLLAAAKETKLIITAEEHQVYGGMGSAVAELLAERYPVPVIKFGMNDSFGESGSAQDLLQKYGLTSQHLATIVENNVNIWKEKS